MKKKFFSVISVTFVIILSAAMLGGCSRLFGGSSGKSSKKLTSLFDGSIVAARFYQGRSGESYQTVELPGEDVSEFSEMLGSMEIKKHSFHTDYYWDGMNGIELELDDGSFITYDGTRLSHRSAAIAEDLYNRDNTEDSSFIEVTNCNFWDEVLEYFPDVEDVIGSNW